jgi:hypothetical protein
VTLKEWRIQLVSFAHVSRYGLSQLGHADLTVAKPSVDPSAVQCSKDGKK